MSVRIEERRLGEVVIVDVYGKVTDGDSAIHDTVKSLASQGVRHVVLNFAAVSYIDSVGLSTLVRAHLALRQHGGALALLHVPRQIAATLTATRLTSIFQTFDDESVAILGVQSTKTPITPSRS